MGPYLVSQVVLAKPRPISLFLSLSLLYSLSLLSLFLYLSLSVSLFLSLSLSLSFFLRARARVCAYIYCVCVCVCFTALALAVSTSRAPSSGAGGSEEIFRLVSAYAILLDEVREEIRAFMDVHVRSTKHSPDKAEASYQQVCQWFVDKKIWDSDPDARELFLDEPPASERARLSTELHSRAAKQATALAVQRYLDTHLPAQRINPNKAEGDDNLAGILDQED